jgi:cell wall assembly regulator SMI1
MRGLAELQLRPRRSNPFPTPTPEQFTAFETYFGVTLPPDYRAFLSFCNGGSTPLRAYADPNGGVGEVNDFYGLGTRESDETHRGETTTPWEIGNLWGETRIWRTLIDPRAVPFGRDGGDNQLFLDFRSQPPAVARYIFSTGNTYKIAESFADFVGLLRLP